jgi:hypothetical protein
MPNLTAHEFPLNISPDVFNNMTNPMKYLHGNSSATMDTPRKPRPVYNLFFQKERARVLGMSMDVVVDERAAPSSRMRRKHRKTHGRVSFRVLSRNISDKWQSMTKEEKNVYKAIYHRNYEAYKKEMEKYERLMVGQLANKHSTGKSQLKCCSAVKSAPHELPEVSDGVFTPDAVCSVAVSAGVGRKKLCPPLDDAGYHHSNEDASPLYAPTPIAELLTRSLSDLERDLLGFSDIIFGQPCWSSLQTTHSY